MEGQQKTIRFRKAHTLKVGNRELRFRQDDVVEVGDGMDISEKMARDLIRSGVAVPGCQHTPAVAFRFDE